MYPDGMYITSVYEWEGDCYKDMTFAFLYPKIIIISNDSSPETTINHRIQEICFVNRMKLNSVSPAISWSEKVALQRI